MHRLVQYLIYDCSLDYLKLPAARHTIMLYPVVMKSPIMVAIHSKWFPMEVGDDGSEIYLAKSSILLDIGSNKIYDDREEIPPLYHTLLLTNAVQFKTNK